MESELQKDLEEALEGVDPLELLIQDPVLAELAQDLCSIPVESEAVIGSQVTALGNGCDSKTSSSKRIYCANKSWGEDGLKSCKVCEQASKCYVHYGALVCASCRAFFSRAIKNRKFEEYVCVSSDIAESNNCLIDSKAYKTCKKCRFSQCLLSGMRIPDKYSSKDVKNFHTYPFMSQFRQALAFCDIVTTEERRLLRDVTLNRFKIMMECRSKFMTSDLNVFKQILEWHYQGQIFPLRTSRAFEDFTVYCFVRALSDSGEFADNLTRRDRVKLLSKNSFLAYAIFAAQERLLGAVPMKREDFNLRIDLILEELGHTERNECIKIRKNVLQNGTMHPNTIRYWYNNVFE